MRALTFKNIKQVRVEEVDEPKLLTADDVIVRVSHTAICGSDLHVYHGREKGMKPGTVMGHEFVGVVEEAGHQVEGLAVGDRVFSPFTTNCGQCASCKSGLTCRCEHGQLFGWVSDHGGLNGVQTERVRVPLAQSTLKRIPTGLSPEVALLLGDVLSTGAYCAERAAVSEQGSYAVIGCGPVGLMAITACRWRNAGQIYAIDLQPDRLAKAREWGAIALTPAEASDRNLVVDGVLEAVGSPAASRLALQLVRPGGVISIVGVHNEPHFAITPTEAYDKNLSIHIGRCPARRFMDELMPFVNSNPYDLASIFTHQLDLDDAAEGYEIFDQKRDGCLKVMLKP